MEWRRTGDFRQRARASERATKTQADQARKRTAARTRNALEEFEGVVRDLEAQYGDGAEEDDLPLAAEAGHMHAHRRPVLDSRGSAGSGAEPGGGSLRRSSSEIQVRGGMDHDPCHKRPPSPLGLYDYGCVSRKPRSLYAQQRSKTDDAQKSHHRSTSCGFYFPGAQFKQGPYGFSMLDPHLLPRKDGPGLPPPTRWENDAGDARPLTSEVLGRRRNFVGSPVISESVRSSRAHDRRAQLALHCLGRKREDTVLEQVRFENGVYGGSWRDPLLDRSADNLEETKPEQHDWLDQSQEAMNELQREACQLLADLERAVRGSRGRLNDLFLGGVTPGVIEPEDFLKALVKHGVLTKDARGNMRHTSSDTADAVETPPEASSLVGGLNDLEQAMTGSRNKLNDEAFLKALAKDRGLRKDSQGRVMHTVASLVEVMHVIDPSFDGRVNLPKVARAIAAARGVQSQRVQQTELAKQQHHEKIMHSYSETLPVEVVKVDRESRSLFNFQRSFDKFREQQMELLKQHNEVVKSAND